MKKPFAALLVHLFLLNVFVPAAFAQDRKTKTPPVENLAFSTIDITGPAGSGSFGQRVLVLSNNNIVVADPGFDDGATVDVGAVYLYSPAGVMISQLKGSTANDQVGSGGLSEVGTGNFVALSPDWDNGGTVDVGAATWIDGTTGLNGTVSSTNSLVGATANDKVGSADGSTGAGGVIILGNGNYLIGTLTWDNGAATDVGAVTFGLGASGVTGAVSSTNSLVGSTANDQVGSSYTLTSADGDYLVLSPNWNNGAVADVGAATFGSGTTGVLGAVSTSNSLVGSTSSDKIGFAGFGAVGGLALSNGNFVVRSALWNNGATADAGAVTWIDGTTGLAGVVSASNSLVGTTGNTQLGIDVSPLIGNSNYVVVNSNGPGSATWCSGSTGRTGTVSSANSLVGSVPGDFTSSSLARLSNGNYVIATPSWDGTAANVGAVTWGNGTTGTSGTISSSTSLVGSVLDDRVGSGNVYPLSNGNYVVVSLQWDNGGITNVGAATWGNGATGGTTGAVSASNSITGSTASDTVGSGGVAPLTNGNYVVVSPTWDNGAATNAGAATWAVGTGPTSAVVSAANSLVGTTSGDGVGNGNGFVAPLTNGNYVVPTSNWDNGAVANVGAVTWGNGTTGITGPVTTANSLVGSTAGDQVGLGGIRPLPNGDYAVSSLYWINSGAANAGAVTLGNGATGTVGVVSDANSLVGTSANDYVGAFPYLELSDGKLVFWHYFWNNGATAMAGAWTLFDGTTVGPVSSSNSVVGNVSGGGFNMIFGFNGSAKWAIGKYSENKVTIPGSAPTSARAKIEGKVVTADRRGIRGASVTVTDALTGLSTTVTTNNFGKFVFEGLDAGGTYIVSVAPTRRYRFAENVRSLQLYGDEEVLFTAER